MKLKIAKIKRMLDSFSKLDGYDVVEKVDGKNKVIWKPYELSGKTRWNIAKNVAILSRHMEGFEKVQNDILLQVSGGKNFIPKEDTEKISEFIKQVSEVTENEEDVNGLIPVTASELKLDSDKDVNPFPSSVINGLYELLQP